MIVVLAAVVVALFYWVLAIVVWGLIDRGFDYIREKHFRYFKQKTKEVDGFISGYYSRFSDCLHNQFHKS